MKFWLMKSEPDVYGIKHLKKDKVEMWEGCRNYQVRNFFRDDMRVGDLAIFSHSMCKPAGPAGASSDRVGELKLELPIAVQRQDDDVRTRGGLEAGITRCPGDSGLGSGSQSREGRAPTGISIDDPEEGHVEL